MKPEDRAAYIGEQFQSERRSGYTIVLDDTSPSGDGVCRETALPFAGEQRMPAREEDKTPERIREMRRFYEYGRESAEARAANFYRQGQFMQDYEDDVPWTCSFVCYFPTYHDLTTRELRAYFSWRTKVRKGIFQPAPASCAFIYLYELLNCIGVPTPEEALRKMREFESGYPDSGTGGLRVQRYLREWMIAFAVLHDMPAEIVREAAGGELLMRDRQLMILRSPDSCADAEVCEALCFFGGKKIAESPVLSAVPGRGAQLLADAWRRAAAYRRQGKDLFALCFGERERRNWYPLYNAVYYKRETPGDREYVLSDCRRYILEGGSWYREAYESQLFDRGRFGSFLHEADALLRRYLKTGRYLKEKEADIWVKPYIEEVIAADQRACLEAARPKVSIDPAHLAQIRADAEVTRDALLKGTEEEAELRDPEESGEAAVPRGPEESGEAAEPQGPEESGKAAEPRGPEESGKAALLSAPADSPEAGSPVPLKEVEIRLLRALLSGGDVTSFLREQRLMPSLVADAVNEALFDEIGDTVLLCEDDRLSIVEEYTEDLKDLLGC